jgi:hypothetical protein
MNGAVRLRQADATNNTTQYFISGLSNSGPVNKVAEALANRIIRAVREQQPFKVRLMRESWLVATLLQVLTRTRILCGQVVVVLPILPDPGPLTWPGRAVTRLYRLLRALALVLRTWSVD